MNRAVLALLLAALLLPIPLHASHTRAWRIEVMLPQGGPLLVKPALYEGVLTIFMPDNSSLLGVRAADGVLVFNESFPEPINNYAVLGDGIIAVLSGHSLYVYEKGSKRLLGTLPNDSFSPITGFFMPAADHKAFLPLNHSLAVVSAEGYRLVKLDSDVQHIIVLDDQLAVAFTNNTVKLLQPQDLHAVWETRLSLKGRSGIYLVSTGARGVLGISAAMVVNETAEKGRMRSFMILANISDGIILNATYTDEFPVAARLFGDKAYVVTYQPTSIGGSMGLYAYLLGSEKPFLNKTLSSEAGVPLFLNCRGKLRILLYKHYYNVTMWPPITRPMLSVYSSEGGELHRYIVSTVAQANLQVGGFKTVKLDDELGAIMVYTPYAGVKPVVLFYVPSPDPCLTSRLTEGYWSRPALYAATAMAVATIIAAARRQGGEE